MAAMSSLFLTMTLKVCALSRSSCLSWVDSRTDFHSQKMLKPPIRIVKNGAGRMTDVMMSMHDRHSMGRKYFVAFSTVILKPREVVAMPACLAFRSPATKSTAMASMTAMYVSASQTAVWCSDRFFRISMIVCIFTVFLWLLGIKVLSLWSERRLWVCFGSLIVIMMCFGSSVE